MHDTPYLIRKARMMTKAEWFFRRLMVSTIDAVNHAD